MSPKGLEMVDFLVDQGVKLNRVSYWPDYYDELPGRLGKRPHGRR